MHAPRALQSHANAKRKHKGEGDENVRSTAKGMQQAGVMQIRYAQAHGGGIRLHRGTRHQAPMKWTCSGGCGYVS